MELDESADSAQEKDASTTAPDFDVAKEYAAILAKGPMVIFSKSTCPYSSKLKKLLRTNFQFSPEPVIVELDKHEHGDVLQGYIKEETGRGTVPNLIVGGLSRGGSDDIQKLFDEGTLLKELKTWGFGDLEVTQTTPDAVDA